MPQFHYRLAQLLQQKEAHQQECEKQLALRRAERRRGDETLAGLIAHQHKLEQAVVAQRHAPPAAGTGDDWQNRATDLAIARQRVEDAKDEVFSQQLHLEGLAQREQQAAAAVQAATREVETLRKHRARAEQKFQTALARKEELEQEEIAATLYEQRRRA